MRSVRRRGTEAELRLEAALREGCLCFRTHVELLGCTPDIVFSADRLVVFVDGDFWHGRLMLERGPIAFRRSFRGRSRTFWIAKITRNIDRDARQVRRLRRHGWSVMRLWEKDVLKDPSACAAAVARRLQLRRLISTRWRDVA